jgi:ABC-2 type transport system ATP-binding protein
MIQLKNVVKTFDSFTALDDVSLEIPKGMAYGLLGSNGAGKSTILRLLAGIYLQESGEVAIDGEKVYENPAIKEKVIFINDETIQWNACTIKEMKEYFKLFYSKFSDDKFNALWEILKLPENKKLSTFSKGMRRQAIVMCGIACQPDYLLLDEAFDGLDPTMRIIVKKMLFDAMLDNEMTAVISSHNLKEIDEFCDKAGLLHKGKLVFNRDLDSLKGNVHKIQTAFDREYSKEDFSDIELLHFDKQGSVVYLIAKGETAEVSAILAKKNPKLLDIVPLTLEEIFIYEMEVLGYEYTGGIDGIGLAK